MASSLNDVTTPVNIIPGLTGNTQSKHTGKLLRRPLPPKILPALVKNQKQEYESSYKGITPGSVIQIFRDSFNLDALRSDESELESISTDRESSESSVACPPPTSGSGTEKNFSDVTESSALSHANIYCHCSYPGKGGVLSSNSDKRYILDPVFRERTKIGSHVNGNGLVRIHKLRGPDPLPARVPKKNPEMVLFNETGDERFDQSPAFILDQFLYKFAQKKHISLPQVRHAVYSKYNFKKLTNLLAAELQHTGQENIHTLNIDSSGIPVKKNRVPQRQLLYEMAAVLKASMREIMKKEVRLSRRDGPDRFIRWQTGSDRLRYEECARDVTSAMTKTEQTQSSVDRQKEISAAVAVFSEASFDSSNGLRCSRSQISANDDEVVSPSEMAVLDSLITGGAFISFEAHFIDNLPDISPITASLTYLNLSFNNFKQFPPEVMFLSNLEVLKMRNNPLKEIPTDVNKLQKLRVLIVSFCLITTLPKSLFDLSCLEDLSLAYNNLTVIPSGICQLKYLQILDLEGNQIPGLPATCLYMDKLTHVNVRNNFMHPVFWHEGNRNQPQSLQDLSCVVFSKTRNLHDHQHMGLEIGQILAREEICDICKGPMFGPGLQTIRPVCKLFSIKYLPLVFRACTPACLHQFQDMSTERLCAHLYDNFTSKD